MQHVSLPRMSLVLLLGVSGCHSAADQAATTLPAADSAAKTAVMPPPIAAAYQRSPESPVSVAGQTFRLKSFPVAHTTGEAPQFTIYLYPNQRPDSLLVAQDTAPSVLEPDQGTRLGVPKTAVLLFQTYYAGAGYQYYVVTTGNQVRVYRRNLVEATAEKANQAWAAWHLLKTFGFFTRGIRELTP